jgi:hypothetical protein
MTLKSGEQSIRIKKFLNLKNKRFYDYLQNNMELKLKKSHERQKKKKPTGPTAGTTKTDRSDHDSNIDDNTSSFDTLFE